MKWMPVVVANQICCRGTLKLQIVLNETENDVVKPARNKAGSLLTVVKHSGRRALHRQQCQQLYLQGSTMIYGLS